MTYTKPIQIEFDPAKNEKNICERGLSFERVTEFDFETAVFRVDDRRDYGGTRIRALGLIDGRLYALVFTEIPGGVRVIQLSQSEQKRDETV